ncbi:hypothetical protein [Planomicrobium okeanokoites]|uniref:hypothetical protein n=1 Tax=Planomicrobium okeanokoites TaxID=244 RepID=UPI003562AC60
MTVMAFFAIVGKAEATRGAGHWSLDMEKRKRPLSSDKRKTIWRNGVIPAMQPKWLTTRGVGRWSLDKEKRKR